MSEERQVTNYCPMCVGYVAEIRRLRDGLKNMSLTAFGNMEGADSEGFEAWESVHVACEELLDHLPGVGKKDGAE